MTSYQSLFPIQPDGVPIFVAWHGLAIGASVFIPAINLIKLRKQMTKEAERRGFRVVGWERIESGKLGMRFWRVL
jgi:hypothetical protein